MHLANNEDERRKFSLTMKSHAPNEETEERKLIFEIDWHEQRIAELNAEAERHWEKLEKEWWQEPVVLEEKRRA
jgi:hypothetical protein